MNAKEARDVAQDTVAAFHVKLDDSIDFMCKIMDKRIAYFAKSGYTECDFDLKHIIQQIRLKPIEPYFETTGPNNLLKQIAANYKKRGFDCKRIEPRYLDVNNVHFVIKWSK